MISLLLLVLLAGILLYRYLQQHYTMFAQDNVPGPKPTMVIGNLAEFANKNPLDVFVDLTKRFGKVFGYYEGMTPSIVVSDPALIEQILVKRFYQFDGRPPCCPFLHGPEYHALPNLNGQPWKQSREVIGSAFKTSMIRMMWPRLRTSAIRYITQLEQVQNDNSDGFDIVGNNEAYCLESFASACFDIDPDSLTSQDMKLLLLYMRATHNSAAPENRASGLSRTFPSLASFFKLFDTDHKKRAMEYFHYISQRLHTEKCKMDDSERPTNILQHFLAARTSRKDHANNTVAAPLPEAVIQGMTSSLFGGGLGPTTAVLDFTVHCLAVYPDKQERLREEVLAVCGEEDMLPMDMIQSIEYLDMFVNESLRHYTVAPGVARTCSEDCVVGGTQFRKGTVVRLMGCVQHRDHEVYPDPEQFRPERFSKEERNKRHPYSFIPFGNGPRMCVAKRLGLLQIKLAVVKLVQHFRVCKSSLTQTPLPVALRPFLCPKDGVFIRLEPREQ
ncbi:cytochrome P450 3A6-like [Littorina saxatilis]|uniref:cytochrome P450 3A6-like n=1 Tax=Littorina saxatilis TaxID=31220 RepID=UPI0038B5FCD9